MALTNPANEIISNLKNTCLYIVRETGGGSKKSNQSGRASKKLIFWATSSKVLRFWTQTPNENVKFLLTRWKFSRNMEWFFENNDKQFTRILFTCVHWNWWTFFASFNTFIFKSTAVQKNENEHNFRKLISRFFRVKIANKVCDKHGANPPITNPNVSGKHSNFKENHRKFTLFTVLAVCIYFNIFVSTMCTIQFARKRGDEF